MLTLTPASWQYDIRFYWHYGRQKSEGKKEKTVVWEPFRMIVCQITETACKAVWILQRRDLPRSKLELSPKQAMAKNVHTSPRVHGRVRCGPPVAPSAALQMSAHKDPTSSF